MSRSGSRVVRGEKVKIDKIYTSKRLVELRLAANEKVNKQMRFIAGSPKVRHKVSDERER